MTLPALTPGVLTPFPLAQLGRGIATPSKHVRGEVHTPSGKLYFCGGDYGGLAWADSYRQEVWSLDLVARFTNPADRNAGWALEYPYEGFGAGVQPKHPDYVGFPWIASQGVFLQIPGQQQTASANPPGETAELVDDAHFLTYHTLAFHPERPYGPTRWENWGGPGPNPADTWMSPYDAPTDTCYRPVWHGGFGFGVDCYHATRRTWTTQLQNGKNALGQDVRANKTHLAHDPDGRAIYFADMYSNRLHRIRLGAALALQDLGPIPGLPYTGYEGHFDMTEMGAMQWDRGAKALVIVANPTQQILLYDPATAAWTVRPTGRNVAIRSMTYHPALGVHFLLDRSSANFFLYTTEGVTSMATVTVTVSTAPASFPAGSVGGSYRITLGAFPPVSVPYGTTPIVGVFAAVPAGTYTAGCDLLDPGGIVLASAPGVSVTVPATVTLQGPIGIGATVTFGG